MTGKNQNGYHHQKSPWNIKMTSFAKKTDNPLRKIWEGPKIEPNPNKELISLQIGKNVVNEIAINNND